jgi:hypothetical protein
VEQDGRRIERFDAVIEELIGDTDSPVLVVQAAEDEDGRDLERLVERCALDSDNGSQVQERATVGTRSSPERASETARGAASGPARRSDP